MKKILIIATLGLFTMTSCKKDRVCNCTLTLVSSTDNGVTQPLLFSSATYSKKLTKVSKNGAHCNSGTETDTHTEYDNADIHTIIDVSKMDCKLE